MEKLSKRQAALQDEVNAVNPKTEEKVAKIKEYCQGIQQQVKEIFEVPKVL